MLTMLERTAATQLRFIGRPMPDGKQVLVPQVVRPRTCRRLDGVTKIAYSSRAEAKAAKTKHDALYHCPHCGSFHLATKVRRRLEPGRIPTPRLLVA
jgi:hypothetical protein